MESSAKNRRRPGRNKKTGRTFHIPKQGEKNENSQKKQH